MLSYLSGLEGGDGNLVLGRKITQSEVLELGARRGFVHLGEDWQGGEEKGKDKEGAEGGEKIPRIIHQIWINYEGVFQHVVGAGEGKGKDNKKHEEEENTKKGKTNTKEHRPKSTDEEKWVVTGGEGLEYIPQEWVEQRRTCKDVNRGWQINVRSYVLSLSASSFPLPLSSSSFIAQPLLLPATSKTDHSSTLDLDRTQIPRIYPDILSLLRANIHFLPPPLATRTGIEISPIIEIWWSSARLGYAV